VGDTNVCVMRFVS